MMDLQKRVKLCNELIELAKEVRDVPQKTWASYPEEERAKAEDSLMYAKNFMRSIFEH